MNSGFVALPEEIITLILKAISDPPTAARCLQVCTNWRTAIDRAAYWRDLYYASVIPKKFELVGDLPADHRLNTPFWKERIALTYSIQQSIRRQKCFPRIIAATTIDSNRIYYHPRTQSCNKTHCAITWELERPMDMSTDNEFVTQLIQIGTDNTQESDSDTALLHGDHIIFCDVTAYRTADLSSISSVKFNPQTFDFSKPRPDRIAIPDALRVAKRVDIQSKYFIVGSIRDNENWTVNVVDLDARQIIFSENYRGLYPRLVAHGTRFALLTTNGITVVDFISKQKIFSTNINAKDTLLFEDTLIFLDKKNKVVEVDLSTKKRQIYSIPVGKPSKIFFYQGLFVLLTDHSLYFYTTTFEMISKLNLPHHDVANLVTLANGNMVLTFDDDGAIFNISFNSDLDQLVQLDLVDPNGKVEVSEVLESFRKVNQPEDVPDGVTSLYFHRTEQKRYGMLKSVFRNNETLFENNDLADQLKAHSLTEFKLLDCVYQTPFRNIGFVSEQAAQGYGINQPKSFKGTIGIFCEEKIDGQWVFVKPNTNEWQALLN